MTIDLSNEASTADPTYTIKSRVIDMKQLDALKKKLPKGIDLRISSSNVVTFRVRFRKRGYPGESKTFSDLKLAKKWLIEQQRNADMGIYLPHLKTHSSKPWSLAGLCPFHTDKQSGSFYVNLNTGAYKCFSCGMSGGDVIDFIRKRYQLSFKEAVSELSHGWRGSC
jgi:hypothetical protein